MFMLLSAAIAPQQTLSARAGRRQAGPGRRTNPAITIPIGNPLSLRSNGISFG